MPHRNAPAADRESAERALLERLRGAGYRPESLRDLLETLHVPRKDRPVFRRVLRDLLASGLAVLVEGRKLAAAEERVARGRIHVHPRGFGFVRIEGPGRDVFVPPRRLGGARHGDSVEIRILGTDSEGRPEGEVTGVVDRRGRRVHHTGEDRKSTRLNSSHTR